MTMPNYVHAVMQPINGNGLEVRRTHGDTRGGIR